MLSASQAGTKSISERPGPLCAWCPQASGNKDGPLPGFHIQFSSSRADSGTMAACLIILGPSSRMQLQVSASDRSSFLWRYRVAGALVWVGWDGGRAGPVFCPA